MLSLLGGADSIPGWEVGGTKIPHVSQHSQKAEVNSKQKEVWANTEICFLIRTEVHIGDFQNIHFWSWASLMASGTQHGGGTLLPFTMLQQTGCSYELNDESPEMTYLCNFEKSSEDFFNSKMFTSAVENNGLTSFSICQKIGLVFTSEQYYEA